MTDLTFTASVGGNALPFTRFSMTGGAYGSVGHVTITTSNTALLNAHLDLFALTSGAPGFVEVAISVQQPAQSQPVAGGYGAPQTTQTTSTTRIFGGEYLRTDWDLDADTVTIHARDWAGVLVDQKRILTKIGLAVEKVLAPLAPGRVTAAGISNENQTISNIVQSICTEFGFTPVLNLSATSDGNPVIGSLYGSADQSFITVPQSLWTILNQMARDTGYVVYVTPTKQLVFGEPGIGLPTLQLAYNVTPGQGQLPCRHVKIEHHPRRNSTFRVLVISYDPTKAQTTIGRATYIGNGFAGQAGLTAGLSTGQAAVTADANILGIQAGTAGGSTLSADQALPQIAQYESGNQNVPNATGPGGTPASTASGYYQIINGTWTQFASQVPGASQYPTAMAAPQDVQTAVATKIYNQQGLAPWASNTRLMAAIGGGSGANISSTQIPLYSFNLDGLTADQANLKAQSIATDIAKRELILSATVDGLPSILPTQMIKLSGDVAAGFTQPTYYVSGYQQDFTLPTAGSRQGDAGWITKFTALSIPVEGLASGGQEG